MARGLPFRPTSERGRRTTIHSAQRGLIRIFTLTILATSLGIVLAVAIYGYVSLSSAVRRHLLYEIHSELVPFYRLNDLTSVRELSESDYFQILNRNGEVVVSTVNAQGFGVAVNRTLLAGAYTGQIGLETASAGSEPFLVAYFPLDDFFVGRAATSLAALQRQRQTALWLAVFGLPLLGALSFLVSRYLVRRAMRPVRDLFTFHSTFASNVSHELRSPLTSLKGNLEVALRREQTPEEYRAVLKLGLQEAERLVGILDDFNLLAASQSRGVAPLRSETDLQALLADLLAAERKTFAEGRLSLDLKAHGPVLCHCDAALVRHALRNLVENALRYAPPGATIAVDARTSQGQVTVTLANPCEPPQGPLGALLEPFVRGENRAYRLPHGRGLGLYLAQSIARAHGGHLALALEPGPRFVVTLSLPVASRP